MTPTLFSIACRLCAVWSWIPPPARSKARKSPAARKPLPPILTASSSSPIGKPATPRSPKPASRPKPFILTDSQDQRITLALAPTSDRVVVTATGAPLALEDAGVSATVFTSADFAARANPFLDDYLRDVPGINVVQTGRNGGADDVFARGGDSSSTLVLLDGVPLTEPGGQIDLAHLTTAGIDRMEVIRGPESALFGAEASSAVIQIFTRHGDAESTTPARLARLRARLVFDRPLDRDARRRPRAAHRLRVHRRSVPLHRRISERRLSNHIGHGESRLSLLGPDQCCARSFANSIPTPAIRARCITD